MRAPQPIDGQCERYKAARSLREALINFPLFEKNNYLIEIYFRCILFISVRLFMNAK